VSETDRATLRPRLGTAVGVWYRMHWSDSNPGEGWRSQGDRANASNNTPATDKAERRTFGEIRSEVLVQLVKVSFGDDGGIQSRVIGALVRRALWLECAALIAGNPRVGRRRWGRRCSGSARRPLHDVHSAYGGERVGDSNVKAGRRMG
jgi:hypothetical protein